MGWCLPSWRKNWWVWIVVFVMLVLISRGGVKFSWWLIFPLLWFVVPVIRHLIYGSSDPEAGKRKRKNDEPAKPNEAVYTVGDDGELIEMPKARDDEFI